MDGGRGIERNAQEYNLNPRVASITKPLLFSWKMRICRLPIIASWFDLFSGRPSAALHDKTVTNLYRKNIKHVLAKKLDLMVSHGHTPLLFGRFCLHDVGFESF